MPPSINVALVQCPLPKKTILGDGSNEKVPTTTLPSTTKRLILEHNYCNLVAFRRLYNNYNL